MKNIFILIVCILGSNLIGASGTIFTRTGAGSWYEGVIKPSFNPPNWVFGPVWTLLFTLMGIAFYLIIKNGINSREIKLAALFFIFQFVLNVLWSYLFFGLENPMYSFVEIIFLWIMILATILSFYKVNHVAAYLLIPYILWVSFAAFLNYSIWRLN